MIPIHILVTDLLLSDFTAALGSSESGGAADANPLPAHSLSELKLRCKYRRGLAYYELGRFDDVVKDCIGVIGQDPNSVQARGKRVVVIYLSIYLTVHPDMHCHPSVMLHAYMRCR